MYPGKDVDLMVLHKGTQAYLFSLYLRELITINVFASFSSWFQVSCCSFDAQSFSDGT